MFSSFRRATAAWFLTALFVAIANAQTSQSDFVKDLTTATAAPPYAVLQYATITGSGNTITASWVPIVTSTGTIYKNITIAFQVDASGNLTIATGYPQYVVAPMLTVSNFVAGKYVGPSSVYDGSALVNIAGPGTTTGGATEWTLAAAPNANYCTYPGSANWYVGTLSSNPYYSRISAAGITSTAYSYGIGESTCNNGWSSYNSLLGFSQSGNTVTIVNFTDTNGKDHSVPQNQITYTLSQ